ncbi:hypothetical protein PSYJA_45266, partial [Pseudomonas syringae pv. japonica str. M301072]
TDPGLAKAGVASQVGGALDSLAATTGKKPALLPNLGG